LGLGTMLEPDGLTAADLSSAIGELLADAEVARRADEMRKAVAAAGGAVRAADEIERHLARSNR